MAYPDDKETWVRVETDDIITKVHKNEISVFLESLQDILGLLIKGAFGSLVERLNANDTKVDGKVSKSGDDMTGVLQLKNDTEVTQLKKIYFDTAKKANIRYSTDHPGLVIGYHLQDVIIINIDVTSANIEFSTTKIYMRGNTYFDGSIDLGNQDLIQGGSLNAGNCIVYNKLENTGDGKGVIVKTPDGTKRYRIAVDNAGNITTALVV